MWKRDPETRVWIYLIIVSYKCKWLFWLFNNILVSLGKKLVCVHIWVCILPWFSPESECCDSFFSHTTWDFESVWYIWTQWPIVGGFILFLYNHLKRLDQATQVIYSFKKYICLINTPPGTLQVLWLSLSSPLGLVVSWQQQGRSSGFSLGLAFITGLLACTGRWAKCLSLTWSSGLGECCSHGALYSS